MSANQNSYEMKRENFGSQKINFRSKEDVDLKLLSIKPDAFAIKNFELKNPKSITISNIPEKSSHIIHTEKTKTKSISMKHLEGAWPDSVKDYTKKSEIINWKRTKEK